MEEQKAALQEQLQASQELLEERRREVSELHRTSCRRWMTLALKYLFVFV